MFRKTFCLSIFSLSFHKLFQEVFPYNFFKKNKFEILIMKYKEKRAKITRYGKKWRESMFKKGIEKKAFEKKA